MSFAEAVASLNSTIATLDGLNQNLENSIQDLKHLPTVIKVEKVFDVVPEKEVTNQRDLIAQQTEPQIAEVVQKAEQGIARMERRRAALISKAELQQVRLHSDDQQSSIDRRQELRNENERLQYSLNRIKLQHRHARLSMGYGLRD